MKLRYLYAVLFAGALFYPQVASAALCPPAHTFTTGETLTNTILNLNPVSTSNCLANIDYTNIGSTGLNASSLNPSTSGAATFGGTQSYTFPSNLSITGGTTTNGFVNNSTSTLNGNTAITGNSTTSGNISWGNGTIGGTLYGSSGNINNTGNLAVGGGTTTNGFVNNSTSTLNGNTTITGNTNTTGNLLVGGGTTTSGLVDNSSATITGGLSAASTTISGGGSYGSTVTSGGAFNASGGLGAYQGTNTGTVRLGSSGANTLDYGATTSGAFTLNGSTFVGGPLHANEHSTASQVLPAILNGSTFTGQANAHIEGNLLIGVTGTNTYNYNSSFDATPICVASPSQSSSSNVAYSFYPLSSTQFQVSAASSVNLAYICAGS